MGPIAVSQAFGVSAHQIYIANLLTIFAVQKLVTLGIEEFQEMPIAIIASRLRTAIVLSVINDTWNGWNALGNTIAAVKDSKPQKATKTARTQ